MNLGSSKVYLQGKKNLLTSLEKERGRVKERDRDGKTDKETETDINREAGAHREAISHTGMEQHFVFFIKD